MLVTRRFMDVEGEGYVDLGDADIQDRAIEGKNGLEPEEEESVYEGNLWQLRSHGESGASERVRSRWV